MEHLNESHSAAHVRTALDPHQQVAAYMVEAQKILLEALALRKDPADALKRLAGLLCTPEANNTLFLVGAFALQPCDIEIVTQAKGDCA